MVRSVYFLIPDDMRTQQEDVVALAEGFRELGISFHGSADHWLEEVGDRETLIRRSPDVGPEDCDLVIVGYMWPFQMDIKSFQTTRRPLPDWLFRKGRRFVTVHMDNHDGHRTVSWESEFRNFDLILRTKLNRRAAHPANIKPWAYGLNRRIVRATENAPTFATRPRTLAVNYNASHHFVHGARKIWSRQIESKLRQNFAVDSRRDDLSIEPSDPYDRLMWGQTDRRYSRDYYERLKNCQAVGCVCGDLIPGLPFNPESLLVGGRRAAIRRRAFGAFSAALGRRRRLVQWDSFRFWEALAAGSVAIHLDLDIYGVDLPAMPIVRKHYVGVDLARIEKSLEFLDEPTSRLESIARDGREWAIRHYSPRAAAARLLEYAGLAQTQT